MATDYATLKKGGFMRQKQKNHFSLRLSVVGGQVSADQLVAITEVANKYGITDWNTEENLKLAKDDEKIGKKKYGIKEVPYFIFPNDEVVEGSSDPETFLKALEQAYDNL